MGGSDNLKQRTNQALINAYERHDMRKRGAGPGTRTASVRYDTKIRPNESPSPYDDDDDDDDDEGVEKPRARQAGFPPSSEAEAEAESEFVHAPDSWAPRSPREDTVVVVVDAARASLRPPARTWRPRPCLLGCEKRAAESEAAGGWRLAAGERVGSLEGAELESSGVVGRCGRFVT
ncbi:MAG: hypothetical protein M1826_007351 [Phylliscum demangeonii]|nr:MAG: hypothetical protein M1826_007351 [Phylliscum demangeonii]